MQQRVTGRPSGCCFGGVESVRKELKERIKDSTLWQLIDELLLYSLVSFLFAVSRV